jgi:hypothetical protein
MAHRVAVAIVHGVGIQGSDFAEPMIRELTDRFAKELGKKREDAADQLMIEAVHWAPVLQKAQTKLWRKVSARRDLDYVKLRKFMVDFAGDAIAYQPTPKDREVYDTVHAVLAESLRTLARTAGSKAPLCVIAHSLGTIIGSNYFYDLSQSRRPGMVSKAVREVKKATPLENGETLTLLYTLGRPIAVWSLRYKDFGVPIPVPAPELTEHHPGLSGEWVNFYDPDDGHRISAAHAQQRVQGLGRPGCCSERGWPPDELESGLPHELLDGRRPDEADRALARQSVAPGQPVKPARALPSGSTVPDNRPMWRERQAGSASVSVPES